MNKLDKGTSALLALSIALGGSVPITTAIDRAHCYPVQDFLSGSSGPTLDAKGREMPGTAMVRARFPVGTKGHFEGYDQYGRPFVDGYVYDPINNCLLER
jgi:hypothetical protein